MNQKKIYEWLNFHACEPPEKFNEYFYEDVVNYLENSDLKSLDIKELMKCENIEEVKAWLDKVAGYVVMKIDVEQLLQNYFEK